MPDASSPFRIPPSARNGFSPWLTQRYRGWCDVALFESLSPDQAADPEQLFQSPSAEVVRARRNLTARVRVDGRVVWLKQFRPAHTLDRLAYAARPGKAVYAWNAAMALAAHGFLSPAPVIGLRETGRAGGARGIVGFEAVDEAPLGERLAAGALPPPERDGLASDLGRCLQRFHDLGLRHRDLRQGNILAGRSGDGFAFCFLDLNRLRVQPPLTWLQRLREVEKLNLPSDVLGPFFRAYMPEQSAEEMAAVYEARVGFADRLERLPLGRLLRKSWYYSWELRAFSRSRRP